eukprot:CAMPEP_0118851214 /NCGR_PEP_ID=MMETSP1163-20130328/743_1 /TAXON_ID=124430 /ORGANISM="Phaeomonas parva, Strain CCMP2877" /LENGTH=516 /DNA_ID=CAMNT_0006783513 /DNA_START=249 /DNA_END=1799 /DNA_ORIENTATION=-
MVAMALGGAAAFTPMRMSVGGASGSGSSSSSSSSNQKKGLKAHAFDVSAPPTSGASSPDPNELDAWRSMECLEPADGFSQRDIERMNLIANGIERALAFNMPDTAPATEPGKVYDIEFEDHDLSKLGYPATSDSDAWASLDCLEAAFDSSAMDVKDIHDRVNAVNMAAHTAALPLMRQTQAEQATRAEDEVVVFRGGKVGDTTMHKITAKAELGIPDHVDIHVKCEYENPTGSIKDRIAKYMLEKALSTGQLTTDMTIVEASSGNTGASVALIAKDLGVPCIIITNKDTSAEKVGIIASFGAEVVLCPSAPADSSEHYQNTATRLYEERLPNAYTLDQYNNPLNSETYYYTLGPEIAAALDNVDYVVAGSSTGGTLAGTGKFLKEAKDTTVVLSDPVGSVLANFVETGVVEPYVKQAIEGVGKDSIPGNFDRTLIDQVEPIVDKKAVQTCHDVLKYEGLFVGGSSGVNIGAAIQLANKVPPRADGKKVNIVTMAPDGGFKYLSKYYSPQWLAEKGM